MNDKYVYPQKVLLAWGESIAGNKKITRWLSENGYKELAVCSMALRNQDEPRKWLLDKGFKHLMALVEGCEGNRKAVEWLRKNNFDALAMVALAGDGEDSAAIWLRDKAQLELHHVAGRIRTLKNGIEERNNDPYRISY